MQNHLIRTRAPLLAKLRINPLAQVPRYRFWQSGGGVDVNLWTIAKVVQKAEYCHRNPVVRGLVRQPEQWRYSSFRWLELGGRDNEPLAVDDWDERLIHDVAKGGDPSQGARRREDTGPHT